MLSYFYVWVINNLEGLEDGESDNGFTEEKSDDGVSIVGNNTVSGGGAKPGSLGDPKILNMGPYDGILLKTGNEECWMKSPDNTALVLMMVYIVIYLVGVQLR